MIWDGAALEALQVRESIAPRHSVSPGIPMSVKRPHECVAGYHEGFREADSVVRTYTRRSLLQTQTAKALYK